MTSKIKLANYVGLEKGHGDKIRARLEEDSNGCFIWTGAVTSQGYGNVVLRVGEERRYLPPHRVIYILEKGPIGALEVDHLCRNRLCCNPEHLEAVTSAENTLRGKSPSAVNATKTHCSKGHPFNEENTWRSPTTNRRKCRICQKARRAARYRDKEKKRK